MTYEVRDPEIELLLKGIASRIKKVMPSGWGFSLFIFSYGAEGSTFYISSANRDDFIQNLREFIAREASSARPTDDSSRGLDTKTDG